MEAMLRPDGSTLLVRGVATYGLEFLRAVGEIETMYVPIGLGSGICGSIAAREALGLTRSEPARLEGAACSVGFGAPFASASSSNSDPLCSPWRTLLEDVRRAPSRFSSERIEQNHCK
jgi:hypothetical protein